MRPSGFSRKFSWRSRRPRPAETVLRVTTHRNAAGFLARAEPWLLQREALHNLVLSLAYARALAGSTSPDAFWATVETSDGVVGCAVRTPPHKLLVTHMPPGAGEVLVTALEDSGASVPSVLGPHEVASEVARAWVGVRGGAWEPGIRHGIYQLDRVVHPAGVAGSLRVAEPSDVDLGVAWARGFAHDTRVHFPTSPASVSRWVERRSLFIWEVDDEPVSMAVAQGRTRVGARVGFVYTPLGHRRRGYASACVATLTERLLDSVCDFVVLYTDLANPTSNAIYQRIGYYPIGEVVDLVITGGA